MRRFNECVFDDMVYGSAVVYTGDQYAVLLGSTDQRTLHVLASEPAASGITMTVQIEQSPDGIHWKAKNATAEINAAPLTFGAITSRVGTDNSAVAGDGLARLAISLSGPGGPSAALRVYVTGRDRVKRRVRPCPCSPHEDADPPPADVAQTALVNRAIDNVLMSEEEILSDESRVELARAGMRVAGVPEEERAHALLAALGDDARIELLDAIGHIQAEMEGQRMLLVRGGRPRRAAPLVDPRAFGHGFHERLQHEPPVLALSPADLERVRTAMATGPAREAAVRAMMLLSTMEGGRELLKLMEHTVASLGG